MFYKKQLQETLVYFLGKNKKQKLVTQKIAKKRVSCGIQFQKVNQETSITEKCEIQTLISNIGDFKDNFVMQVTNFEFNSLLFLNFPNQ